MTIGYTYNIIMAYKNIFCKYRLFKTNKTTRIDVRNGTSKLQILFSGKKIK